MLDTKKIRQDFPILSRKINGKQLVYLDNAATSQKPQQVIEAEVEFIKNHMANVHRGLHSLSEEASQIYEEARKTVAGFIGADADELVFVRNATEGLNLVAFAWGMENLKKGDEVISTVMEHHSNLLPWQRLAEITGAKLKIVDVTEEGVLDLRDLESKLSTKTKLMAVGQMSNTTGTINPIEEMIKKAHRAGARVVVDAAQSVQHLGVDVKKIKADFLAFSGHKMMGPMGIGGVYLSREVQAETGVFMTGGGMINEVDRQRASWAKGVEKWEAGTPNVSGAVGLAAAAKYHRQLGMNRIREHEAELTQYALDKLKKIKGIKIVGPEDIKIRGGVLTFVIEGIHAHDVAQILDTEAIAVRSGHHCTQPLHKRLNLVSTVRASFYIYNTKEEVDKLIEGLEKVRRVFK